MCTAADNPHQHTRKLVDRLGNTLVIEEDYQSKRACLLLS